MKKLSPNNNQLKLTLPIILLVIGMFICILLLKHNLLWLISGIILISGIGIVNIHRTYNQTENVYYDSDFLYLKNKIETRKIELNKIKRLKMTLSDQRILGFQFNKYRIEFTNRMDMMESVTCWISFGYTKIKDFEEYMNNYSPETKIEHSASTFDN